MQQISPTLAATQCTQSFKPILMHIEIVRDNTKNENDNKNKKKEVPNVANVQSNIATEAKGNTATRHQCTICAQRFESMQDCLRHELLQHTNETQRPQKGLRNKISGMLQVVQDNKRDKLHSALSVCSNGEELNALCKFYAIDEANLNIIYTRVHNCLQKEMRNQFNISAFGSIVSELALHDSDIDLYIKPVNDSSKLDLAQIFKKVNGILRRSMNFTDIICIRHARVPIIKCKHVQTGFSLDINMSSPSSVKNSVFLRSLVRFDDRLHKLLIFMKVWAKQLQVIGRGSMTSYCLVMMVLFYLQTRALLPSIKAMQERCPRYMIKGINYAYNLKILTAWPTNISTIDLIRGFFSFYQNVNFSQVILSLFLGKTLPIAQFQEGKCNFPEFEAQRICVLAATGEESEFFLLNRCMCVQDTFNLSHNIAKSISPPNLAHFRECINNAVGVCADKSITSDRELLEQLLFRKLEELVNQPKTSKEANRSLLARPLKPRNLLSYSLIPSRAEMRTLQDYFIMHRLGPERSMYFYWAEQYITAITELISEIYCIDLRVPEQEQNNNIKKMKRTDESDLRSVTWQMCGTVDIWTGRNHQRTNNLSYLACQRTQTNTLMQQRSKNPNYAVNLCGTLELNIKENYQQIDIIVKRQDCQDLQRTSPLSRFFAALKCSLQCFRLKEKLDEG